MQIVYYPFDGCFEQQWATKNSFCVWLLQQFVTIVNNKLEIVNENCCWKTFKLKIWIHKVMNGWMLGRKFKDISHPSIFLCSIYTTKQKSIARSFYHQQIESNFQNQLESTIHFNSAPKGKNMRDYRSFTYLLCHLDISFCNNPVENDDRSRQKMTNKIEHKKQQ